MNEDLAALIKKGDSVNIAEWLAGHPSLSVEELAEILDAIAWNAQSQQIR